MGEKKRERKQLYDGNNFTVHTFFISTFVLFSSANMYRFLSQDTLRKWLKIICLIFWESGKNEVNLWSKRDKYLPLGSEKST